MLGVYTARDVWTPMDDETHKRLWESWMSEMEGKKKVWESEMTELVRKKVVWESLRAGLEGRKKKGGNSGWGRSILGKPRRK